MAGYTDFAMRTVCREMGAFPVQRVVDETPVDVTPVRKEQPAVSVASVLQKAALEQHFSRQVEFPPNAAPLSVLQTSAVTLPPILPVRFVLPIGQLSRGKHAHHAVSLFQEHFAMSGKLSVFEHSSIYHFSRQVVLHADSVVQVILPQSAVNAMTGVKLLSISRFLAVFVHRSDSDILFISGGSAIHEGEEGGGEVAGQREDEHGNGREERVEEGDHRRRDADVGYDEAVQIGLAPVVEGQEMLDGGENLSLVRSDQCRKDIFVDRAVAALLILDHPREGVGVLRER